MAQDLTNAQWAFIEPLLPKLPKRADGRGRPWRDSRAVLNGILWVLRTGAQWAELPSRYPPYQTCHRRFQKWRREGVMDRLLEVLAKDLEQRGKINLDECFVDGSFSAAKRGRRGRQDQTGQRLQDHGDCRPLRSSCLPMHSKCYAARDNLRRTLRRYKRRWKIERLFAWLQNYRRLVTRYEHYTANFLAFLKLAAFSILAKKYL